MAATAAAAQVPIGPGDAAAACLGLAAAFTPAQRKAIEAIVKDYLINNPEVMLEVQNALEAKMDKIQAERMAVAIKENAGECSARPSPIVGNPRAT